MTDLPAVTALDLELDQGWLTIWFNQPEKRNAFTEELTSDLRNTLEAVRDDRAVRGITLRGRGGVFCAGGDLKAFKSTFQGSGNREDIVAMSRNGGVLFDLVNTMPQVVIVLIEGAAMAGGFGLACCADVVLCEQDARFAMTEAALGLSPAQIAPFVIQKLGYATGRRLMLTAARFRGSEAQALGFADFVAEDVAGLEVAENQLRKQVLACAPGAIAGTKQLLAEIVGLDRSDVVDAAANNFADRMLSDEAREGIAAFLEKRKPSWVDGEA
jgi:isohexenylglutaconyl-CoA hydratase